MSKRIHEAARDVHFLWNEAPPPINTAGVSIHTGASTSHTGSMSTSSDFFSMGNATFSAPTYSEARDHSAQASYQLPNPTQLRTVVLLGDGGQSDDASAMVNLHQWLDTLKSRGKGRYTCPYETRCRKGAVGDDGELVVFVRNSDFR